MSKTVKFSDSREALQRAFDEIGALRTSISNLEGKMLAQSHLSLKCFCTMRAYGLSDNEGLIQSLEDAARLFRDNRHHPSAQGSVEIFEAMARALRDDVPPSWTPEIVQGGKKEEQNGGRIRKR